MAWTVGGYERCMPRWADGNHARRGLLGSGSKWCKGMGLEAGMDARM